MIRKLNLNQNNVENYKEFTQMSYDEQIEFIKKLGSIIKEHKIDCKIIINRGYL